MELPHHELPPLEPAPVQRAELGVSVAVVGMLGKVLDVQQLERHAGAAMLAMDRLEVWQRVLALGLDALAQHALLELLLAVLSWREGPVETLGSPSSSARTPSSSARMPNC
jgi:hypothetical protein